MNQRIILILCLFISLSINCFGQWITWQRVLNNNYAVFRKTQQVNDGGYIAVGNEDINGQDKIYLVKFDYLGNTIWEKIIGSGENIGYWVEQTSDNGYIIGGGTDSKAYIIKTDIGGNVQWEKTFLNSILNQCYCVK